MALENVQEVVTLTGESVVNETVVVSFNCRVAENGIAGSIVQSIRDHDLYQEHRTQVRQDLQAFQGKVWAVEDRLSATGE
jgi:hypothetical protein